MTNLVEKKFKMSRNYAPLSETHQNKLNFSQKKTIFHEEVFLDMYISALTTLLKNRGKPEFFLNKNQETFVQKTLFSRKNKQIHPQISPLNI